MGSIHFEILEDGYLLKGRVKVMGTGVVGVDYDDAYMRLRRDGTLYVKPGYKWDGRSGPAIDTADSMRSSVVHDALYQLIRTNVVSRKFRRQADRTMLRLDKEDGVNWFRRWYSYLGLRLFGGAAI